MKENPLLKIQDFGQSIWLDFLRRKMITSGELKELIEQDGLRGVTSNPKIFDKVIAGSHDYDDQIRALALEGKSTQEIYEVLTVQDVQDASDLTEKLPGFVGRSWELKKVRTTCPYCGTGCNFYLLTDDSGAFTFDLIMPYRLIAQSEGGPESIPLREADNKIATPMSEAQKKRNIIFGLADSGANQDIIF